VCYRPFSARWLYMSQIFYMPVRGRTIEEVPNMFTRSPIFIRMQRYGQQFTGNGTGGVWWLLMAPGVALTLVALAILVWPELLAYMVASVLLFAGMTLMLWSWRLRRAEQRMHQDMTTIDRHNW
jgi:Flp pilus assembly protein TadB